MGTTDDEIFAQTNAAIWILTSASGAFLLLRLWCRFRYSKLWWDDGLLWISWLIMLVACALLSRTISSGYETDDEKRNFFLFQNTSASMTTIAIAWTKIAFAITLLRIIREKIPRYVLWTIALTANMVLILGMLSIWIPACGDPRKIFRPAKNVCMDHKKLQYLGGTTMVYGGIVDVTLALFPWFVIRKLLLETREKIGLTIAMSLGAFTGTIVIFRTFYQLRKMDNDYHFMIFVSIFNFLEPSVTIIAQAIPMFRVLFSNVKKNHARSGMRLTSPTGALSHAASAGNHSATHKSHSMEHDHESWESKVHGGHPHGHPDLDSDHELLQVHVGRGGRLVHKTRGPYDIEDDKLYDSRDSRV